MKAPTIGDNVYFGSNVVVLGEVVINNNAMIGANSVVLTNIPENCFAAGNPARPIKKTDSSDYIIRKI